MFKKTDTILMIFSLMFCYFVDVDAKNKKPKIYKEELAIATIFQNEAPYLSEWIDYHHMLGVDKFYLYNHNSTDDYEEVLKPYIESGLVIFTDFSDFKKGLRQMEMMQHAIDRTKARVKWLAFIDSDEFIYPKQHRSLKEFLKGYENFGAVAINWECFGTNDVEKIPEDGLIIDYLTRKAEKNNFWNAYLKCIVRPDHVKKCCTAHSYEFEKKWYPVRPDKDKYGGGFRDIPQNDIIVINHYWTRDLDYFYNVKVPRCMRVKRWSLERTEEEAEKMNRVEDFGIVENFSEDLKNFRANKAA